MSDRKLDELRAAGGELSECADNLGDVSTIVERQCRNYEVPRGEVQEAVSVFLNGLADALAVVTDNIRRSGDC